MNAGSWGYHLLLDVRRCKPSLIRCPHNISIFSRRLVENIDMVAYGAPHIVRFGTGDKAGYTLVQLIETSNITAHFCEETGDAYFDVFSCKHFHQKDVLNTVQEFFAPEYVEARYLLRGRRQHHLPLPQLS